MKNEFALAFNEVIEDKQLPRQVILEAIEAAMVSAYRRAVNASNAQHVEAKIDPETGRVVIYAEKEIVDEPQDDRTEVAFTVARKIDPAAELGSIIMVEATPDDFGRVAAQTARQVIQQRIREAERDAQFEYFARQLGEIISGVVQAVANGNATLGIDMKAEGALPYKEQIPGERFRLHERVRALLLEVKQTPRGPQITLSRSHRNFLRRLLENEVPEIYHGLVEIRSIAREPGQRSKVAVAALKPGVDPVGACVGIRGVRIQAIVRELNDEKIDVIEWNPDPTIYIAKALSPARVSGVYLNEQGRSSKTATVVVPEDHLSLAIGRDGQNARLAAKLTGWRIDIKSLPEAASDLLFRLQSEAEFAALAEREAAFMPQVVDVLSKKAAGRPVTPEEYQVLNQFVDRVERTLLQRKQDERKARDETARTARGKIPAEAFEMPLEEMDISVRVAALLRENGFENVGDLMVQLDIDSDKILAIQGIGPKAMGDIQNALSTLIFAEEAVEEVEAVEAIAEEVPAAEVVEAAPEVAAPVEVVAEAPAEAGIEIPAVEAEAILPAAEAAPSAEAAPVAEGAEAPAALDTMFEVVPDMLDFEEEEEEEEFEDEDRKGAKGVPRKKKKKKKKKFVEMEYDPDRDVLIVTHKRKRDDEWDGTES
jgi:N utilization substance protein A